MVKRIVCVLLTACVAVTYTGCSAKTPSIGIQNTSSLQEMLMYGKEASNRKQEIDRQHYTIPNQRPKDKHCGKI